MIERAPEVLGAPIASLGIRVLLCGGEPGAGIPEVRQRIESTYDGKLFDAGAGLGCSCDYPAYQGMHSIADALVIYERVDADTLAPIPLSDGATGQAVFTSVVGGSMGWTRLTIGDIHQATTSSCPRGAAGFRYRIMGRVDDMLKVKGVIVYPAAIDSVIAGFIPRVTGEFRIQLDEAPLKLRIERAEQTAESAVPALEAELLTVMHERLTITPKISWVAPM